MKFPKNLYYPSETWDISHPKESGFDTKILEDALNYAEERRSSGVIVLQKGHIIAERYWNGWNKDSHGPIYSATKAILSFLFGIALKEGHIDSLDQSITDYLVEWKNSNKKSIKIKHLLGMCSGLRCSFTNDFVEIKKYSSEFNFALTIETDSPPEQHWSYNNTAYRLLFTILERATGRSLEDYCRDNLCLPLGMQHFHWGARQTVDAKNYHFIDCSVRDLARFGLLVLAGGLWQDEVLVNKSFLEESFTASQSDNPCYGYLWWLNSGKQWKTPYKTKAHEGPIFPDCPKDTVAALGFKDNKVYVVPSLELVVVRLGDTAIKQALGEKVPDLTMSGFDNPFLSQICRSLQNKK